MPTSVPKENTAFSWSQESYRPNWRFYLGFDRVGLVYRNQQLQWVWRGYTPNRVPPSGEVIAASLEQAKLECERYCKGEKQPVGKLYDPEAAINSRKPLRESNDRKWPFFNRYLLDDAEFEMKFLNHTEKCPDGFKMHTTHTFESKPDQDWQDQHKVLCTEATHGLREAWFREKDPKTGKFGAEKMALVPVKPCPICDFIEEVRRTRDEDGDPWFETLDEDIQRILNSLTAPQCRSYLFPVLLYAREYDTGQKTRGSKPKPKMRWKPDSRQAVGVILNLTIGRDNADLKLYKLIKAAARREGDQMFNPNGQWFTYTKSRGDGAALEPSGSRKMDKDEMALYKEMPNIMERGKGISTGNFKVPSQYVSWDKGIAMLQASWFGKSMDKAGFDFESIEQGLASKVPNEIKKSRKDEDEDEEEDERPRKKKQRYEEPEEDDDDVIVDEDEEEEEEEPVRKHRRRR